MNRDQRQRRLGRLKIWAGLAAVLGLGVFTGLAAAATHQQQRRTPAPSEQLSRLENYLGYPFWDVTGDKLAPAQVVPNPPQTSSGGS